MCQPYNMLLLFSKYVDVTFSANRLSNFIISVGDSFDPVNKDSFKPSTSTQCAHVPRQLDAGETRVVQCTQAVQGRYVTVNLEQENALTLCEFQVHGTPAAGERPLPFFVKWQFSNDHPYVSVTTTTEFVSDSRNLVLKKPAWQSSNYSHDGLAHEAVDGDPSNNFFKDYSCTHTQGDPIPWWTVDLQGEYLVTEVVITNRGDCCGNASDNFWLRLYFCFFFLNYDQWIF